VKHRAPAPSIWPVTLALGVALAVIGVLSSWILVLAGAVLFVVALFGWITQALHEAAP
jgi:Cytochrome c oxidase subunit IV